MSKAARKRESLIWTERGKLRLTAALTVLLAAHLLTTLLVVQLVARADTVAVTRQAARIGDFAGPLLADQVNEARQ
ncbi:MAG TPA: hypothetical protein VK700_17795 [Steroidobacteraceae bacterium]|jgi:hypothetical protein|nr:hypothetical protein [Steroidobacteraceae bacterium]